MSWSLQGLHPDTGCLSGDHWGHLTPLHSRRSQSISMWSFYQYSWTIHTAAKSQRPSQKLSVLKAASTTSIGQSDHRSCRFKRRQVTSLAASLICHQSQFIDGNHLSLGTRGRLVPGTLLTETSFLRSFSTTVVPIH